MHTALIVFHRWLALATSVFILILALTGSALVFEGAIDRGLNPQLWRVPPAGQPLSLDTLAARALAGAPRPLTVITPGRVADRAFQAQAGQTQIFLDPYTGRLLGTREQNDFNRSLPRRLHVLHVSLLAGSIGGEIVGIVTMASLLLVVTGIIIWWRDRLWRIHWSASWKRIAFDMHHSLGIIASLVLFVITASGMVIHYETFGRAIAKIGATPRTPPPRQPPADSGATPVSFDAAATAARAALPGASIAFVSLPANAGQPLVVSMRFPEDRTPGGRSRVLLDRYRGTVLMAESTRAAPAGRAINNAMRSVHTGDILGKPTEVVWLLGALVLASQAISGALMWWNARASRLPLLRRGPIIRHVQ